MPIEFFDQNVYVTRNGELRRGDFGGVSIIGIQYNNIFFPRGILYSKTRILRYSLTESNRANSGGNLSLQVIPNLLYFKSINTPPLLTNYYPYFLVAELTANLKVINSKCTVKDALKTINLDVLFNDSLSTPLNTSVDFSNVQTILVNVGGHNFRVPYINPLVIP